MYLENSTTNLAGVSISNNASDEGGGIYCSKNSLISFNRDTLCNIYANNAPGYGSDIKGEQRGRFISVFVDTFTTLTPTERYASPLTNFRFYIRHQSTVTAISDGKNLFPNTYHLYCNFPNPFNPTTNITYDLPRTTHAKLTIHDILGRKVKQLVDEQKHAGQHTVVWDATNENSEQVSTGLYLCKMEADGVVEVIKLALVK